MNKFLRYSLTLLFACVASITFAAEPYKVLTFPDDNKENNGVDAYTKDWTAKMGDDEWTIQNFNNHVWKDGWNYIKCGSKKAASVGSITSPKVDQKIGYVVVSISKITANMVEKFCLDVVPESGDATCIEESTPGNIEAGDYVFKIAAPIANATYKLSVSCLKGSSNGLVTISKIALYKEGDAPTKVDISNTEETAYTVAKAMELIDAGEGLSTEVYVKGIVSKAADKLNETYGSLSYYISDNGTEENQLQVYGGLSFDGQKFESVDDIKVGDEVIVKGFLKKYNDAYELDKNNVLIKKTSASTGISSVTVDAAKNAAVYNLAGQKVAKSYKGVVIKAGKKMIQK